MGPPGATFAHFGNTFGHLGHSFTRCYAFLSLFVNNCAFLLKIHETPTKVQQNAHKIMNIAQKHSHVLGQLAHFWRPVKWGGMAAP